MFSCIVMVVLVMTGKLNAVLLSQAMGFASYFSFPARTVANEGNICIVRNVIQFAIKQKIFELKSLITLVSTIVSSIFFPILMPCVCSYLDLVPSYHDRA